MGQVVPFIARLRDSGDWTAAERARLQDLASQLSASGVHVEVIFGATDDYGYHAVENKIEMHDLHATILHLLGIDHKRLTFRFSGRDMRLTDVHGNVIEGVVG